MMKTRKIIENAGVYFCAICGAGYASGQTVMQFFTNFGLLSIPFVVLATIGFAYFGQLFINMAYDMKTSSHKVIFHSVCGKWLGSATDYFITFITFGCIALMFSGAATTLTNYFGVPQLPALILVAAVCLLVVLFGFSVISAVSGIAGPVILVTMLVVCFIAAFHSTGHLSDVPAILETAEVYRSAPNLVISLILYLSFAISPHIATLAGVGHGEEDRKVRTISGVVGGLALGICLFITNQVLLANYGDVYTSSIPLVELAVNIWKPMGLIFGVILIMSTMTTAISLLYGTVSRFTEYGTKKSKIFAFIIAAASVLLGLIPFAKLVNTLYPLLGYVGAVVLIAALIYKIRTALIKKETSKGKQ